MERAKLVAAEGCEDPPPGSVTQRSVWRQRPARLQRGARLHRTVRLHDCCSFEGEPRSGKMLAGEKSANRRNRTVTGVSAAATRLAPTRHAPQIPMRVGPHCGRSLETFTRLEESSREGEPAERTRPDRTGRGRGKSWSARSSCYPSPSIRAATGVWTSAAKSSPSRRSTRRSICSTPRTPRCRETEPRRLTAGAEGSSIRRPAGSSARAPS